MARFPSLPLYVQKRSPPAALQQVEAAGMVVENPALNFSDLFFNGLSSCDTVPIGLRKAEQMTDGDPQERDLRKNTTNLTFLKNWWIVLQAAESIRSDYEDKGASFWLAAALQCLVGLSLEFGIDRVVEAIPPEQRDLLYRIISVDRTMVCSQRKKQHKVEKLKSGMKIQIDWGDYDCLYSTPSNNRDFSSTLELFWGDSASWRTIVCFRAVGQCQDPKSRSNVTKLQDGAHHANFHINQVWLALYVWHRLSRGRWDHPG
jgi:hypothetical protein